MNEEDRRAAMEVRRRARHLAWVLEGHAAGRMKPKDIPGAMASELADTASTAAWCIGWLLAEVRRLEDAVHAERTRAGDPYGRILGQVRSLEGRPSRIAP